MNRYLKKRSDSWNHRYKKKGQINGRYQKGQIHG